MKRELVQDRLRVKKLGHDKIAEENWEERDNEKEEQKWLKQERKEKKMVKMKKT
jgi:hypothetical protein